MTRRTWIVLSVAAGSALGLAYTLSPITVCVTAGVVLMLRSAGRGLPEEERRWLVGTLAAAFAVRVAAVAVLFLISPHDSQGAGILFGDEAYALSRSWRLRNVVLQIPQLKFDYMTAYEDYGRSSYLWVMTYLQVLTGPAPYGLRVLNAALFLGAVLLLFRLTRRAFGPFPAFAGLAVLLALPTLFFWSISLLKESIYLVLSVVVLASAIEMTHAHTWRARCALALAGAVGLWALRDLRAGAVVLALAGLAAGSLVVLIARVGRPALIGGAALAVPFAVFAIIATVEPAQRLFVRGVEAAAMAHGGHVFTVGHAYKLLDDPFYIVPHPQPQFTLTVAEAGRFVVRAAVSYVAMPAPWQMATRSELMYLPEQLLWYTIVLLAPVGIVTAFRRDRVVASLLLAYLVPTAVVVALTTGNVGTLIRHRTLVFPYVIWISAMGFAAILRRVAPSQGPPR